MTQLEGGWAIAILAAERGLIWFAAKAAIHGLKAIGPWAASKIRKAWGVK